MFFSLNSLKTITRWPTLSWFPVSVPTILLATIFFLWANVLNSTFHPIQHSAVWSLCYFTHAVYILLVASALFQVLAAAPTLGLTSQNAQTSSGKVFLTLFDGVDLLKVLITPVMVIWMQHAVWVGPVSLSWSNHLVFATFQCNWTYILLALYASFLGVSTLTMHFSSVGSFDFSSTLLNFFIWLWLMCLSNNLLTFIFFLEVLSASVTLTLVTSTFSSSSFYNNISYDKASYLAESSPLAFLQTLMFFFWATLVTSLTLFIMLIVLYIRFFTMDWSLFGALNTFLVTTSSLKQLFNFAFCWTLFITCVFMKCGIAPFYLWKPVLFRGVSLLTLFFIPMFIILLYFSISYMFL